MSELVAVGTEGWRCDIEYQWVGARGGPVVIFLHEGLGSVSMWRDFPPQLCDAIGYCGLVYSRPGYGRSTPRAPDERWPIRFMHTQAYELLPALLTALGIEAEQNYWLFGHSDGASIALLHAARFPERVCGGVALAPHLFVEDLGVSSIGKVREAYRSTDLRAKLARHHDDVDSAFWGWNDVWLDPAFRYWNIERDITGIRCPLLAMQGENDEFGTMRQIERIAALLPQTALLKIADCGHSPHRDQAAAVIAAASRFFSRAWPGRA